MIDRSLGFCTVLLVEMWRETEFGGFAASISRKKTNDDDDDDNLGSSKTTTRTTTTTWTTTTTTIVFLFITLDEEPIQAESSTSVAPASRFQMFPPKHEIYRT